MRSSSACRSGATICDANRWPSRRSHGLGEAATMAARTRRHIRPRCGRSWILAADFGLPGPPYAASHHGRGSKPLVAVPSPLVLCRAAAALGACNLAQYHLRLARLEKEGQPTWRAVQAATRQLGDVRPSECRPPGLHVRDPDAAERDHAVALTGTMLTAFTVTMTYLRTVKAELEWLAAVQLDGAAALLVVLLPAVGAAMTHAGFMFPVAADPDAGEVRRPRSRPRRSPPAAGGRTPSTRCGRGRSR